MSNLTKTDQTIIATAKATRAQTTRGQIADLEAQAKAIKAQVATLEKEAVTAGLLIVVKAPSDTALAPSKDSYASIGLTLDPKANGERPAYLTALEYRGVGKFFDKNCTLRNKTTKVWIDLG